MTSQDEEELERIILMMESNKCVKTVKPDMCASCNTSLICRLDDSYYCPTCLTYTLCSENITICKKYRPLYNLYKIIRIYTGTSGMNCPSFIVDTLRPIVLNQKYTQELLRKCKNALKKYHIKNKNFIVIIAYCMINKPILTLSNEQVREIIYKFNKFLNHWNVIRKRYSRKNIVKYSWLLIRLLKLIGITGYDHICVIKRRKELYENIWKDVIDLL